MSANTIKIETLSASDALLHVDQQGQQWPVRMYFDGASLWCGVASPDSQTVAEYEGRIVSCKVPCLQAKYAYEMLADASEYYTKFAAGEIDREELDCRVDEIVREYWHDTEKHVNWIAAEDYLAPIGTWRQIANWLGLTLDDDSVVQAIETLRSQANTDDIVYIHHDVEYVDNLWQRLRLDAMTALSGAIDCDLDDISMRDHVATVGSQEYYIHSDATATQACEEEIREYLWAFRPEFLAAHIPALQNERARKAFAKMCEELCEDANPLVLAMIADLPALVADAIKADGRGHFLAGYDGEEVETEHWLIYRNN